SPAVVAGGQWKMQSFTIDQPAIQYTFPMNGDSTVELDFAADRYRNALNPVCLVRAVVGSGYDDSTHYNKAYDATGRHRPYTFGQVKSVAGGGANGDDSVNIGNVPIDTFGVLVLGDQNHYSDDFAFGTGAFTVDFWMKTTINGQCIIDFGVENLVNM